MRSVDRGRGEGGLVLPTTALVASICTVAIAAVGFVLTSQPTTEQPPADTPVAAAPTTTATPTTEKKKPRQKKPAVDKKSVYVVVFNNSNIRGLAGQTATRAQHSGWNVVGSDNWYGTIESSTVYFPPRLRAAARALAKDLHITRLRPAIEPMKFDRLTVILTADYAR